MLKYGTALAGLGALASASALAAAPTSAATGMQLIDFAERLVAPEQIKAAGFDGALVYVSELRPGATFDFKPVTREFTDGMRALGLHVVSCYQYGKPGWPNSPPACSTPAPTRSMRTHSLTASPIWARSSAPGPRPTVPR